MAALSVFRAANFPVHLECGPSGKYLLVNVTMNNSLACAQSMQQSKRAQNTFASVAFMFFVLAIFAGPECLRLVLLPPLARQE